MKRTASPRASRRTTTSSRANAATSVRTAPKGGSRAGSVRASSYDAAAQTRRTSTWRPSSSTANSLVLSNLATLRDRSRQATRNDGYAKSAIDKLVANIVGTGIKPLPQTKDRAFRAAVQEWWLRWVDESDADGLLDFYGQQQQAVRAWLEGGEVFVRLRPRLREDGLAVPLQVQVIEPELCPHTHSVISASGNRIRAGIEFDAIGRRVAYWFHPSRPGDWQDFDTSVLRRVPADSVIHLYDPLRPGQIRGLPHLTQALVRLQQIEKYADAALERQLLANMFVAFLTRKQSPDDPNVNMLTGLSKDTAYGEKPTLSLEPGTFQELDPGEDVEFSDPPETHGYREFMRQHLLAAFTSTGVPYELGTGDMSGLNDRIVRVILNEFRGRIQAWQHHIVAYQLCRRVYRAWMDRAWLVGALPLPADYIVNPAPWLAVKWTPPRVPYIHPVQDIEAQVAEIEAGLTTRSAAVSERGEDAEAIDAEQAADNARADELGLRYTSDSRHSNGSTRRPAAAADDDEPPAPAPPREGDEEPPASRRARRSREARS